MVEARRVPSLQSGFERLCSSKSFVGAPPLKTSREAPMRAEAQTMVDEIKSSLTLLRRHL